MKKLIASLVAIIVVALLAFFGFKSFKGDGPRQVINTEKRGRIVTEELSFYNHGEKLFGRLFLPTDELGNFSDSIVGTRPVVIYFHGPMQPKEGKYAIQSLVAHGVIGYLTDCPKKSKDIDYIVKKISKEDFTAPGMIFIISDKESAETVVDAVTRIGRKIAGLVLREPELQGKAAITVSKHKNEVLCIDRNDMFKTTTLIMDYMEERGAFK